MEEEGGAVQVPLHDYRHGAAVATGLVNTAPEVMVTTGDGLADPDDLQRFLAEHGVHPVAGGRRPSAAELAEVHALRRTLRQIIEAPDAPDAVAAATTLTGAAGSGSTLQRDDAGRWQWCNRSRPGAGLADELALLTGTGLLAVIYALGHDRFRACAAPSCHGLFVDTSRAGRRRYCEPEVCGSRVNAANYRARLRAPRSEREAAGGRSEQAIRPPRRDRDS